MLWEQMTGTILKPSYIIHHAYGTLMLLCENLWAHGDAAQSVKRDRAEVLFLWFQGDDKQVVEVYTAMKVITSFPIQELGAHEWTLQVFGFRFFLFMPKSIQKSICFLSRRFAEAWSNFTKSHLWCALRFINPEISTGMKTPCKDSTIPTPASLLIHRFSFPCIMLSLWKRNRISIYGFYWPQPSITQKDAWDPAVKILERWYL